jgi:hypothetical protein
MDNIYGRVEPLDPTVNVLCALPATFGGVFVRHSSGNELSRICVHIHLVGILTCEGDMSGLLKVRFHNNVFSTGQQFSAHLSYSLS